MKSAFLALVVSGIMAVVGCGSGGSSDKGDSGGVGGDPSANTPVSQVCDKLVACQTLSTVRPELTTADQCKTMADAALGGYSPDIRSVADQALSTCLAQSDCTAFTTCIQKLFAMMPTH